MNKNMLKSNLSYIKHNLVYILLILISLSVISYFGYNAASDFITKYKENKRHQEQVLGVLNKLKDDEIITTDTFEVSDSTTFQDLYSNWYLTQADRVVKDFDLGYSQVKPLVQYPNLKFPTDSNKLVEVFVLSNKDVLKVECEKLKAKEMVFDIGYCSIYLNNKDVSGTYGWTDNKKIDAHFTIFDDKRLRNPILVVAEEFGPGSRDYLIFYEIKKGKLIQYSYQYKDKEKLEKSWWSDPISYMYFDEKNKNEYFVTYFHDPAMGAEWLIRVWEVGDNKLELNETVLEKF